MTPGMDESTVLIPIRVWGGRAPECAIVDAINAPLILQSKWFLGSDGYARRKSRQAELERGAPTYIAMHRQVLGLHLRKARPGDPEVDHINGNKVDNRVENLRVVSRSQNNLNRHRRVGRSQYVGVSFFRPANLWRAYITKDGARIELGYFKTELEAAMARDAAARSLFGSIAKINLEGAA